MKKLRLLIADSDSVYIEAASAYIRSSEQAEKFDLKWFSARDSLEQYLNNDLHSDILLISADLLSDEIPEEKISSIILLEDDSISEGRPELPSVFKFQPLNQLLNEVLSIYYEQHGKRSHFETTGTKVISVYSASGGVGKTTFAVHLCRQMASQGKKVFYLNLELLHSTSLFFPSPESSNASQILYYLKAHQDQLVSKIESFKKNDPYAKVDFFDFPLSAEEMFAFTESETKLLISAVLESENPDYLIIDLENSLHDRVKASFHCSDRIFWILGSDLQSFYKSSAMFKDSSAIFGDQASVSDKTIFILNKYTGLLPREFQSCDLPVQHYLPYIPEWKNTVASNETPSAAAFSKAVFTIIDAELNVSRGVGND